MKRPAFLAKAESALDLSEGVLRDAANITLYGTSLIEVDNFKGLLDFSKSSLRINTTDTILRIDGINLEISYMTDESISVKGTIKSVSFE